MLEILCVKLPNGTFAPVGEEAEERCKRFKSGSQIWLSIRQSRDVMFHRRWFALVRIAFDMWSETASPAQYKGMDVSPEFERFRKDITILCGYYRPVYGLNDEVTLEAESIAFHNMSQERFEALYSATIQVILEKILPNRGLSSDRLNEAVEEVLRFA